MQAFRCQLRLLAFLLCASFALPYVALAQTSAPAVTPAPLPPEAQDALKKGVMAAQQQDYLLAIRYFQDARKLAPDDPEIYKDLGLAESKIPGRELRAICWFEAYLAANPNAPNAAAVREQIEVLDVKSQSNLAQLIKIVEDAASKISGNSVPQENNLRYVACLWARAGDIRAALKDVDLITFSKNNALDEIVGIQAGAGDIGGAQKTANLITDSKYIANEAIASAQAEAADITGAQKTAGLIDDAFYKGMAQISIAEAQARAGDVAGALRTADLIQPTVNFDNKSQALWQISFIQAQAGDIKGALSTAALLNDAGTKSRVMKAIAEIQTKTASTNNPASIGSTAAAAPIPVVPVSDWIKKLDDDNSKDVCALNTDPFLDLASYLKSLPPSEAPQQFFDAIYWGAANQISMAQNAVDKMLRQQAGK
jgi:tetratricopeptide (TPR) repeat protein